ncbi:MAG: hypothetical protein KIH65_000350 [Candidatus Uhrbacteria bacterium]|nr:hypothetical protein [Candidatus Uhrbacteria bacterium]
MNSIHPSAAALSVEQMETDIQETKKKGLRFVEKLLAIPFGIIAICALITPSTRETLGIVLLAIAIGFGTFLILPHRPPQQP